MKTVNKMTFNVRWLGDPSVGIPSGEETVNVTLEYGMPEESAHELREAIGALLEEFYEGKAEAQE